MAETVAVMRTFETGATRNADDNKLDYEGFLSPIALERYAQYLHKHRFQADGKVRESDNWQKGIPFTVYMKSLWRHFMDTWKLHRLSLAAPLTPTGQDQLEDDLCAVMFNAQGYLHELLKAKQRDQQRRTMPPEFYGGGLMGEPPVGH